MLLNDIGIKLTGHRSKIWHEIQKLKKQSKTPGNGQEMDYNETQGNIVTHQTGNEFVVEGNDEVEAMSKQTTIR